MSKKLVIIVVIIVSVLVIYSSLKWYADVKTCSRAVDYLGHIVKSNDGIIDKEATDVEAFNQMCDYKIFSEDEYAIQMKEVTCNDKKIREFQKQEGLNNSMYTALSLVSQFFSVETIKNYLTKDVNLLKNNCNYETGIGYMASSILITVGMRIVSFEDSKIVEVCNPDCFSEIKKARKSQIKFYSQNIKFDQKSVEGCRKNLPKYEIFEAGWLEALLSGGSASFCPHTVGNLKDYFDKIKNKDMNEHSKYLLLRAFYLIGCEYFKNQNCNLAKNNFLAQLSPETRKLVEPLYFPMKQR